MKIVRRWMILFTSVALVGCEHNASQNSLEKLASNGRALEGQRVTVDAYLLDQGSDGLVAGFPAVAGNADPKRPTPVANGCPTEDLVNLMLRFREPMPDTASMDGRRTTVSGVYHAEDIFLNRPSLNTMVYYSGYLDDVNIETLHPDSCAKWTHTGE